MACKKTNGNNLQQGAYYIGLDVGSESVGWAVTDTDYRICKFKGNGMWGIRLFEEAQDASERRANRVNRRRLQRRNQRLEWLEQLFNNEIAQKDPAFFVRLHESMLHEQDKSVACTYPLFNDPDYTDKTYYMQFPTAYHLRARLLHDTEPADVRLVFLALHHILKSRGHFLYVTENEGEIPRLSDALQNFRAFLQQNYALDYCIKDEKTFTETLSNGALGITEKDRRLKALVASEGEEAQAAASQITSMLAGRKVAFDKLFQDESLKSAEKKSFSLTDSVEDNFDELSAVLGDRIDLLTEAKQVFDTARLTQMLNGHTFISDAKISLYEKNKQDLKQLKAYVKAHAPEKYREIFTQRSDKLNNYAAYSDYPKGTVAYTCKQEEFCAYLKKTLPNIGKTAGFENLQKAIDEKKLLTFLRTSDNGLIPNQLHRIELVKILQNAETYLPFLKEKGSDGTTVSEKILAVFDYRIPYYVGPLNTQSPRSWAVRTDEPVTPWNFTRVVDAAGSAEKFMENLIGRCSYTGAPVLPKDSLLYSEFSVLNEINSLKINGEPIPTEVKNRIFNDLFVESSKKATKKSLRKYLLSLGMIAQEDVISGVDETVKSNLRSWHDMRRLLEKTQNRGKIEEVIRRILIFGSDKKMLRRWLQQNLPQADAADVNYLCRLRYQDWGNLSEEFLTGLYAPDPETGEAKNIITLLRTTNRNLMQILKDYPTLLEQAEQKRAQNLQTPTLDSALDALYISPRVRRSLRQTLQIVDEIIDIRKCAPKKIFIEVAREHGKKERTKSRKTKLLELYKACRIGENDELFVRLNDTPEDRLREDKLYLYYTQFGKCMYSGEPIRFEDLFNDNLYDIDHIFPRSRIKDDSLENRVLVKSILNREKTNVYPVAADIRTKMRPFWDELKHKEMIGEKKYARLVRSTPLTDEELAEFVNRQLVETQQSTKALASLLKEMYPETKPVYSKAGNVTAFRQQFGFPKNRDVNDLHHAKDAYLNIVVGNVYDTKFTAQFFKNIRNETYSLNAMYNWDVAGAWDKTRSMGMVRAMMQKNNIRYTRVSFERHGKLSEGTLKPAGQGQLARKQNLEIDKYGAYKSITGAYFCVVEHTNKKSVHRSIMPVYLYQKDLYEQDPIRYCKEVLGLQEPKLICKRLPIDALTEVDGKRLYITGRAGSQSLCKHACQFITEDKNTQYLKQVAKYVERYREDKTHVPTVYDMVTKEKNILLFRLFAEKLTGSAYKNVLRSVACAVCDKQDRFFGLTEYEQCTVLLEILKAFKCDSQTSDLSLLDGSKQTGKLTINSDIQNTSSFYLIHQSVTGLYEYKQDLLHGPVLLS